MSESEISDDQLDQLCEAIHVMINRHDMSVTKRLAIHCVLIADIIGTIECPGCRRMAIKTVTQKMLPHFLDKLPLAPGCRHEH